jgi:predicted nucleic acid-binding protein
MKIVSNTSPIIFLAKLEIFDLIKKKFKKVLLPEEVYSELINNKNYIKNIQYIISFRNLFEIKKVKKLNEYNLDLHKGEKEALVLAIQENAELILLDDFKARTFAKIHNLKVMGTLGVILSFLKSEIIDFHDFEKLLQNLISHNFRIDIKLYNYVLKYAKEYKK